MKVPVFIKERSFACGGPDCGVCASVCVKDCITYNNGKPVFKLTDCTGCAKCVDACFASKCLKMAEAETAPKGMGDIFMSPILA